MRRMQRMGSMEIMLLLIVYFHLGYPASSLPLRKNLTSARLQENAGEKETDQYNTTSRDGKIIAHHINSDAGAAGGRGGSGGGEGGNGDRSAPNTGAAVIPLYAAGAANGHHNRHNGAASCNQIPALWAVISTSIVVVRTYLLIYTVLL